MQRTCLLALSFLTMALSVGTTSSLPAWNAFARRVRDWTHRDLGRLGSYRHPYPQDMRHFLSLEKLINNLIDRELDDSLKLARKEHGSDEVPSTYKPSEEKSPRRREQTDDFEDDAQFSVSSQSKRGKRTRQKFVFCHYLGLNMSGCLNSLYAVKPETQARSKKPDAGKELPSMYLLGGAIGR